MGFGAEYCVHTYILSNISHRVGGSSDNLGFIEDT